jgi:hypothetical protein
MRYRLRTLSIVLAVGPPLLWALWAFWPPPKPDPYNGTDIQYFQRQMSGSAKLGAP